MAAGLPRSELPTMGSAIWEEIQQETSLEAQARLFAKNHRLIHDSKQTSRFLKNLNGMQILLERAYQRFREASELHLKTSYATEWMLDNFHLVEQALRQIREDMPPGYYRQLPKINSPGIGITPRIFVFANIFIHCCQVQADRDRLVRYVNAFQEIEPLTTGELWALPVMLRYIVLQYLTSSVIKLTEIPVPQKLQTLVFEIPSQWGEEAVVSFSILSLRSVSSIDWKLFIEKVSLVDELLRQDPFGVYAWMDFETRDRYRAIVEQLARGSRRSEHEVAQAATRLAQESLSQEIAEIGGSRLAHKAHVGYYLIDEGRLELEHKIGYVEPTSERLRRFLLRYPTPFYLGAILSLSLLVLAIGLVYILFVGGGWLALLLLTGVGSVPALSMSIGLVNWLVTRIIPPRVLPKMDFDEGIPPDLHTLVVIPCLLSYADVVDALLRQIELHYLGNNDPNLHFALLSDFEDAPWEDMPEDQALLDRVIEGIHALNHKHRRPSQSNQGDIKQDDPFLLLHRRRKWNPGEECWMGWERKRGKLVDLNRLILSSSDGFSHKAGNLDRLPETRYVITLDADTSLPREAAQRLIATLAHPLNRAQFDSSGKIRRGYNILQPRIETKPESINRSLLTQICAADTGLDPYTKATSDVYQDLFGYGLYMGKGIYEVESFERALQERIPENALLSHDLFEGIHGRVGLTTDILLFEDHPSQYLVDASRRHRWARGDWQILPWILHNVPIPNGKKIRNDLPVIDRWKILDNLRRTIFPISLLLLFIAGWTLLPGSALFWSLVSFLAQETPVLTNILSRTTNRRIEKLQKNVDTITLSFLQTMLALLFLPFEAMIMLDAIATTLFRLAISHKRLLQWRTMAHTIHLFGRRHRLALVWAQMGVSPLLALVFSVFIALHRPTSLWVATPLLFVWIFSPIIAYRVSQPIVYRRPQLAPQQVRSLRMLACRTWQFFEYFISPEDNWLPPDHFQEDPRGLKAQRTSPTNIGLALVSTLAAHDLGYIGLLGLSLRLDFALEAMDKLERYHGHFLNWYETNTLQSLHPRYISTVDSGNLAGCLLTLAQGLEEIPQKPLLFCQCWQGLLDMLDVLDDCLSKAGLGEIAEPFRSQISHIRDMVLANQSDPKSWPELLLLLRAQESPLLGQTLVSLVESAASQLDTTTLSNLRTWAKRINYHLESVQQEIDVLAPWLNLLVAPPELFTRPSPPEPVVDQWRALKSILKPDIPLADVSNACKKGQAVLVELQQILATHPDADSREVEQALEWCRSLDVDLRSGHLHAEALLIGFQRLEQTTRKLVSNMDFSFLYHTQRQVFHIGYNLDVERLDENYYDLLASEARLASYIAIVKGDVPQSHWLHLARPITKIDHTLALLSWSGTMFEYLMPALFMQSYRDSLLDQSCKTAVHKQIAYGRQVKTPWGISEAGYYHFDERQNYQYRAFGVPGLGFKRDLGNDLVIAPYASLLALNSEPLAVLHNLDEMIALGSLGAYGFYESLDFTQTRLGAGQRYQIVRSYYTHHQGMILLSLLNFLQENLMVRRFHANPSIKSADLLLYEFVPRDVPIEKPQPDIAPIARPLQAPEALQPWQPRTDAPVPQVHLLSNGRFGTLITHHGSGYCAWNGKMLTRWRADTTLDNWGSWVYLHDRDTGLAWSMSTQPLGESNNGCQVTFYHHKVEYKHQKNEITTRMEVVVCPEEDVEIRRLSISNHGDTPRRLRILSYAEIALAGQADDRRHPAFNKLFIQSQYLPDLHAILFNRRPRASTEETIYLAHALVADTPDGEPLYTCSRIDFLERHGSPRSPAILAQMPDTLTTTNTDLDPIMSIGYDFVLPAHKTVRMVFLTAAAEERETVVDILRRYRAWTRVNRSFEQAAGFNEQILQALEFEAGQLAQVQTLLSLLLYPHQARRAPAAILAANRLGQSGLWKYAISGDYPILLARIHRQEESDLVVELLRAYAYWRGFNLQVDLVLLNLGDTGYDNDLHHLLQNLLQKMGADLWLNRRGGVFLLRAESMPPEDRALIETAARVVLDGERGSLGAQLAGLFPSTPELPRFIATLPSEAVDSIPSLPRPTDLLFDNGYGGFSQDGKEYLIYLRPGERTPAPWINVIANPEFGFTISEAGSGYTWAGNSGENRLTPWRNDPISDLPGEAVYLRDEETGDAWSPTPLPAHSGAPYLVRHGAGYTIFENNSYGLRQQLQVFALPGVPVKVIRLTLENVLARTRRINVTYYAEWTLGPAREDMQQFVVTEFDTTYHAILARNPYNTEFGERVAFLTSSREPTGLTTDRAEFLGSLGDLRQPAALGRVGLKGTVGAGLDPCAALQNLLWIAPGESKEITFLLGQGSDRQETSSLLSQYRNIAEIESGWQELNAFWDDLLGTIQVKTPDPAMDILLNRWLLYQALSCRIWGRSALYQSSGAFGFRDQLQDVLSLLHGAPQIARAHILDSARRQFDIGDVLHWWHPPSGRGIRTRCSDDLLWLPYVTAQYVAHTGDESLLQEQVNFLQGQPLDSEEQERYAIYTPDGTATIIEHCRRALEKGNTSGKHGLPLIGSHDWNDGMNRVGIDGRGESVWNAWFLFDIYQRFAQLCERLGQNEEASLYRQQAKLLRQMAEQNAWDGEWYLRAFYDDGAPLGSSKNQEAQIDSLAQSWAVLSGAADPQRARQAMESAYERLVRRDEGLVLLFTPPFDKSERDPGYIKGYAPGTRENGGQYTHAALWLAWAFAELGDGERAGELFQMLNPIYHTDTPPKARRYRVEPYVVAADVYGAPPYTGRGGWTWYTGSAAWMYRLGIEAILGIQRRGETLSIAPCIPHTWPSFEVTYHDQATSYKIQVANPRSVNRGIQRLTLDGELLKDQLVPLLEDGKEHRVVVTMGGA